MVHFYQLFLNTDDVILKLCTSLCQKAKCTLFVWSTVQKFEHKKLQLTIQFRDTNPRYIVQQVSLISLFTGLAVTTSNVKKGMKFQLQASDLSANIE